MLRTFVRVSGVDQTYSTTEKMRLQILIACFSIAVFSCSSPGEKTELASNVERTVVEVADITDGLSRADLSISGMTCEMMCGGAIKKALGKVDGVTATDIEFDADQTLDHAIVTYDADKVSDAELVAAVAAIHDGAYSVEEVHLEQPASSGSGGSGSLESAKGSDFSTELPSIQMPNLMDVLSRILRI